MARTGLAGPVIPIGVLVVALKVATSVPQLPGQAASVAITWFATVVFVVIGAMLLATDVPAVNGWGCLLVAAATVPGDLNDLHFAGSFLSAVGFVGEPLYLVAASALVLRYPRARLTRNERGLLGLMLVAGLLGRALTVATRGLLPDDFYRPRGWRVVESTLWHDDVAVRGDRALLALLLVVVAGLLVRRLGRARGLARQSQAPLVVIGLICALSAAVDQLVWVVGTPAAHQVPGALVRNLSAALIPAALLADLLRRRAAGAAVAHRILTAALTGDPRRLQTALREVLADPSPRVEVADGEGGWLALDGSPLPEEAPGRDVRIEPIVLESGETPLRVRLDGRSVPDEQLLSTALDAVRVGIHNTRLRGDLLDALSALQDSRLRIVEASLAERRRVERNLHDGAQQQFLAVAATLAQTDLVDDEAMREVVASARAALARGLAELRALARGIHPVVLTQGGLSAALPTLCERSPWPVDLRVDPHIDRLAENVEAAAYFLVAELLANVARHGHASQVSVRLTLSGDTLCVTVADDGVGGAHIVAGGGLAGLQDRLHALGGSLAVQAPDRGTTIGACVPVVPGKGAE